MSTVEELRERASELEIEGRSGMNKEELENAIAEAEADEGEAATVVSEDDQAAIEEASDEAASDAASEQDQGTPTGSSVRGVGFRR